MSVAAQKIDVPCPECKARLAVPVAALGKSGRCPHCQTVFPLAMPAQRPAASALSPLTPLAPVAASGLMPLDESDLMPISDAGLVPLPAASHFAPLGGGNPFGDVPQGDYGLQPMAPSPYAAAPYAPTTTLPMSASIASDHLANANVAYEERRGKKYYSNDGDEWGINAGIGGGALMMLIAVVWFVVGLFFNWLFYYPPILFVIGLIAFIKGLVDNISE